MYTNNFETDSSRCMVVTVVTCACIFGQVRVLEGKH